MRLFPGWRARQIHLIDLTFLVGLLVVFVVQLIAGVGLDRHPADGGDLQILCVLVIVCFLIGIERAWELVGGPSVRLHHELFVRVQEHRESSKADRADDG